MIEQRKHPRYACRGGVEIHIPGTHNRTWGNLSDISRAGFYMETAEPWDVGIESEFRLELKGQEIYGLAVIVTSHPGVGMGLSFKQIYSQYLSALEVLISQFGTPEATRSTD